MAFFGKEYTLKRDENCDGFLRAGGFSDEKIAAISAFKPTHKIVQNDDNTYTVTVSTPEGSKETKFTSGAEFEETIKSGDVVKITYIIDDNIVTQINKNHKGIITFKMEFNGDVYTYIYDETITSDSWDGVAHRYYKA